MKTAPLTPLVLLLLTTSVMAQVKTESSDPPDISVLEKSWAKKTVSPQSNQPRADLRTPKEEPMKDARDGSELGKSKNSPIGVEIKPIIVQRYTTYVYKIKVKNNGLKTIKALYWEYQFLDPDTERVVGTHATVSSKKLSPGKTAVFKAETAQPPVALVFYNEAEEKFLLKLSERLIILRVDYTDGSVWRLP